MHNNLKLNLNLLEAMYFFWTSVSSKEKISEKYINDVANDSAFTQVYGEEFTKESVRRCLSALSNREPFTGNKAETIFYSRNLMILEYIDTLQDKMNAFKNLRLTDISNSLHYPSITSDLTIFVVPSPYDTVVQKNNSIILNFFKFHLIENQLHADGKSLQELLETI